LDREDLTALIVAKLAAHMMTGSQEEEEEVRERFGIKPNLTEEELEEYDRYPLD